MNYLVSRQFYNEKIKDIEEFKSYYVNVEEEKITIKSFADSFISVGKNYYWYFWNSMFNCYFQYLPGIKRIIVDSKIDVIPEKIVTEPVDIESWKSKMDDDQTRNPMYTLNVFRRFSYGSDVSYLHWDNTTVLEGEKYKNMLLWNEVTGEKIKFSTLIEEFPYAKSFYLAFPELHKLPINISECRIKTAFIYNLIHYLYDKQRS